MAELTAKRKLAAILCADVAGYSRLTSRDELGTHRRVMEMLDDASEAIEQGEGSVLRYAGDAILAEFPSIVQAVEVAVSIQTRLAQLSEKDADDNRVRIRIGLNLGEVLQDRGEIYGDGVNLAARLESAASPMSGAGTFLQLPRCATNRKSRGIRNCASQRAYPCKFQAQYIAYQVLRFKSDFEGKISERHLPFQKL